MRYAVIILGFSLGLIAWPVAGPAAEDGRVTPSSDQKPKPTDWAALRQERENLLREISDLERDISAIPEQIEAKSSLAQSELRKAEEELKKPEAQGGQVGAIERQRLQTAISRLRQEADDLKGVAETRRSKNQTLREKKEQLGRLDSKIGALLTPENLYQTFKMTMSGIFAGLVLVVMVGFFVIAWKDQMVRQAIFGGAAGIQFVTLFSLVIAIILFGITGILEGKELAALLGGLSGYILGRGTDRTPSSGSGQGGAATTGGAGQRDAAGA